MALKSSVSDGRHWYGGVKENEVNFTGVLKHSLKPVTQKKLLVLIPLDSGVHDCKID